MPKFLVNPITGELDLVGDGGGGGGSGTVTSVGGGVGWTPTPDPIVGAGVGNLDIDDLVAETVLAAGDLFPFVDVSVAGPIVNQRKVAFSDLAAAINASAGTITGGACVNLDGVCVFDGVTGTTLNFRGIKSESAALTAVLDAVNKTVDLTLDADLDAIAALAGTGIVVRTGAGTWATRTLVEPAAGIDIANPDGVAGDPTFTLANDLAALEALAGTGFAVRSAADTWVQRSIAVTDTATVDLTITNGDGVLGNPTLSADVIASAIDHGGLAGLLDDDHPQYLLLAGRTGTTNDALISTSGAQGGTISGSSVANAPLVLNASTDAGMPGTILFHEVVTNINAFFEHFVAIDLHNITLTGVVPGITGYGFGTSNYVAHSNWIYSGSAGQIYGFSVSPQLRSDDGTRTLQEFNGFNFDPELQVGSAGTFTIEDVRVVRVNPVFARNNITGTLTVPRFTGLEFIGSVAAGVTIQAARVVWMRALSVAGALTNYIGLDAEDVVATNARVINSDLTAGPTRYFLRSAGDAVSTIVGGVRIGDNTQPTEKLEVVGNALLSGASRTLTLSTTAASTGALFGNSTTTGNLTIRPNSADFGTGQIHLDGHQHWWTNIPDFTAAVTEAKQVVFFDSTLVMSPTGGAVHTFHLFDISPTITSVPDAASSSTINIINLASTLSLGPNVSFAVLTATGTVTNTVAPTFGTAFLFSNFITFESATSGVAPYPPNTFNDGSVTRYNVGAGSATVVTTRAFFDQRTVQNVLAGGTFTVTNLTTLESGPSAVETAGTFNVTNRRALYVREIAVGGTTPQVTNNIAIEIDALALGATINASMRSAGTGTELRHAGAIIVGSSTVAANATQTLDIVRDYATRRGADFAAANGANVAVATAGKTFFRWTTGGAAQTLDGMTGGFDGKVVIIYNATAVVVPVNDETAGAAAADRFDVPAATVIPINACRTFIYNTASGAGARWNVAD